MRDKRIILCDADDTIENLCQTWVTYLNFSNGHNSLLQKESN